MDGARPRVVAALVFAAVALALLGQAFPARAQQAATILFLSDQHGETICEQSWFDIYELSDPAGAGDSEQPASPGSGELDFGAIGQPSSGRGGVIAAASFVPAVLLAATAQEAGVRRITNAREQTPGAEAYCTIGYHRAVLSPDGSMIAAVRRESSSQVVVVMSRDGSGQRVVSHPQESRVTSVSWAPDGRRLVHDGHDVPGLKIVSIDGSDATVVPNTELVSDPAWSHDGRWIAFSFAPEEDNPRFRNALGVIAPDGTGRRQVTLDPDIAAAARPTWSPDGSEIAFSTQNPGCGGERVSIVPFEGASEYETLPVPSDMCRSGGPAWLSDTTVAFWGAVGTGEPDLYRMQRGDPGSLVQLTATSDVEVDPTTVLGATVTPPDRGLPRTGGDPAVTDDAEPAASRAPLLLGGVVAAVILALLAGRTVLATAGARAGRARTRERERDRPSEHGTCETRWETASERARAARSSAGAALEGSLSELRGGWSELIDSLEHSRAAFQTIAPSEAEAEQDEEMVVVQRLLAAIGDATEEGSGP